MVVADNYVDSLCGSIFNLLVGLDPAVQGYDQAEASVACPVYSFVGTAVTLILTVRDVEIDVL